MKNLDFNTIDNLVDKDQMNKMAQQAQEAVKKVQKSMPEPHLPKHVVLPIFQKKEQDSDNSNQ